MKYLVTTNNSKPFFTNWFDANNHFNKEVEMVVYDLFNHYLLQTVKNGMT